MYNNSPAKTWTIVHFIEDDSVEAVPTNWIQQDLCYWPPWTRTKLTEAIKNSEAFSTCWPVHKIKLFRNATFDDYLSARLKAKRACQTSDLNTDCEENKRRVVKRKIFDSSSDSEAEDESSLPLPPKLSLKAKSVNSTGQIKQIRKIQRPLKENTSDQNAANSSQVAVTETIGTPQKHCCCTEVKKTLNVLSNDMNKKMTSLKANMLQIRDDLNTVIANMSNPKPEENVENFLLTFKFPLVQHETLAEVESYLQNNNHLEHAIQEVSKLGGKDTYEFIKRCFIAIISDTLAKEYTFDGTKVKRAFKETMISSLFIAAAQSHNGADRKITETAIRKWLRRSTERSAYKNRNNDLIPHI